MRALPDIRIEPAVDGRDSLVLALRAVLSWHGADVAYETLAALSGIAAMFAATDREPCPLRWQDDGRDAFLVESAEQVGLSIRDLHPPEAAPLPTTPPEYELHWRDSYVPLVEASLAHNQPVLAWMGWPAPNESQWGIIATLDARTRRCGGLVGGADRPVTLERAAVQAYVVQEYSRSIASDGAILAATIAHTRAALGNQLPAKFGVMTGPQALRRVSAMRGSCDVHHRPIAECVSAALRVRAARRQALGGGLQRAGLADVARVAAEAAAARTIEEAVASEEHLAAALNRVVA